MWTLAPHLHTKLNLSTLILPHAPALKRKPQLTHTDAPIPSRTRTSHYIPSSNIRITPTANPMPIYDFLSATPAITATVIPNVASALLEAYNSGDNVLPPGSAMFDILNSLDSSSDVTIRRARTRVPRNPTSNTTPPTVATTNPDPDTNPVPTQSRSQNPARRRQSSYFAWSRRQNDAYTSRNRTYDASIT